MKRRDFIQTSTGLALTSAFITKRASAYSYQEEFRNKKPRVGLIGTGWYGKSDLFRLVQVAPVEIVSLCDVDKKMLADAAEMAASRQESKKTPRTYSDYRQMLKEKDLDIVLIATPDHWHALPMIEAAKAGADMYCQKPISVDIAEGKAMLDAARKYKRVVQIGTQRRSTPHLIEAREQIVQAGKLGKIGLVEIIVTTTCARKRIRLTLRHQIIWIMKCGQVLRRCVPTTSSCIREVGVRLWNTATASSAICAYTCSTRRVGC